MALASGCRHRHHPKPVPPVGKGGSPTGTGGAPLAGRGGSSGAANGADGGNGAGEGGSAGLGRWGEPGCGLEAAAFCDPFDAPSAERGRAGELDAHRWSGSHLQPDGAAVGGVPFGVRAATLRPEREGLQLPSCRDGLPDAVYPDDDALVCDPSDDIASSHLLVACASQNNGQNSYRIRQPFDFSNRTGKVVFDAEGLNGGLLGWISLDITEEPVGAPSIQTHPGLEGGPLPTNGVSFQFDASCSSLEGDSVGVGEVHVFHDLAETVLENDAPACVPTAWGKLNHFEVAIAEDHVEVTATPFSADGTSFGEPVVVWSSAASLPFSRGYVQITVHNHASLKYTGSDAGSAGFVNLDAWIARFDNVGFDGPIVPSGREYEIPDPLEATTVTDGIGASVEVRTTGYLVADAASGPSSTLEFDDVELDGATSARLALSAWYCVSCAGGDAATTFALRYRFNGNAWLEHALTDTEAENLFANGRGALGHVLDVPLPQLVSGKNTLELVTAGVPQAYPPAVANVDLVLGTE